MTDPILVRIETPSPGLGADPVWSALTKQWRLLVMFSTATGLAAVVLCFFLTPVYRATVLATPSELSGFQSSLGGAGGLGGLASLAGLVAPGGHIADSARALLESRTVIAGLVTDHDLLPQLFRGKWSADKGTWKASRPQDIPTLDEGVRLFIRSNLAIEFDAVSRQVSVSVDWPDPSTAAALANELVVRTNDVLRQKATADAEATLKLLNEQLVETSVIEIRQALFRLIEDQIKVATIAKARTDYALTVLDPAVPPDTDQVQWPRKPFFMLTGAFAGFLFGCLIVIAMMMVRRAPGD